MTNWSKIVSSIAIYGSFVSIVFAITYFSFWNEPSISDDSMHFQLILLGNQQFSTGTHRKSSPVTKRQFVAYV